MTYYIYHIEGVKIGCTNNTQQRMRKQGKPNFEILEEHSDMHIASDREIELQKQYGYKVDTIPYWQTIKNLTIESKSKGGKIGGNITGKQHAKSGHMKQMWELGCINSAIARSIPIEQRDRDGNFIKEWVSANKAGIELRIAPQNINKCVKGKIKTTGGYTFNYKP